MGLSLQSSFADSGTDASLWDLICWYAAADVLTLTHIEDIQIKQELCLSNLKPFFSLYAV